MLRISHDISLKTAFQGNYLLDFWRRVPREMFPNLLENAYRQACIFGSTYTCEMVFSRLIRLKSKFRSSLTDSHMTELLQVASTTMTPSFDSLVDSQKQFQQSHWLINNFFYRNCLNFIFVYIFNESIVCLVIPTFYFFTRIKITINYNLYQYTTDNILAFAKVERHSAFSIWLSPHKKKLITYVAMQLKVYIRGNHSNNRTIKSDVIEWH